MNRSNLTGDGVKKPFILKTVNFIVFVFFSLPAFALALEFLFRLNPILPLRVDSLNLL